MAAACNAHQHTYVAGCGACRTVERVRAHDRKRSAPGRIPEKAIRAHLYTLTRNGLTCADIARHARLAPSTVRRVADNSDVDVHQRTAARILAVPANAPAAPTTGLIDATISVRKIRALAAMGHTLVAQAQYLGRKQPQVWQWSAGQKQRLQAHHVTAIDAMYAALHKKKPPVCRATTHARTVAARNGWAPPSAWPDGSIDDPSCDPVMGPVTDEVAIGRALAGTVKWGALHGPDRVEVIRHMRANGLPDVTIAGRLHINGKQLQVFAARHADQLEQVAA